MLDFIKKTKKGMTLSELLVAISIFSLIMIGVNQFFISSWNNYKFITSTGTASVNANKGISEVVNVLRKITDGSDGSYAILSADDFDLKVFSDIDKDGVVEKVHYYLNNNDLMVGISNPTGFPLAYPSSDSESRIIASNVSNVSSQPIFYFYNGENNQISTPVGNLIDIKMVGVDLYVNRVGEDLKVESFASLRNLSENDVIE